MSAQPAVARTGGTRWRLLVHERLRLNGRTAYGTAHSIASTADLAGQEGPHRNPLVFPSTEFDELVVDHWLHVEQMSATLWAMDIGGVMVSVTVSRDGRPQRILVEGPEGDVPGCAYRCEWSGEP